MSSVSCTVASHCTEQGKQTKPSDDSDVDTVNEGNAFAEQVHYKRRFPHGHSSCTCLQTHNLGESVQHLLTETTWN